MVEVVKTEQNKTKKPKNMPIVWPHLFKAELNLKIFLWVTNHPFFTNTYLLKKEVSLKTMNLSPRKGA